MSGSGFDNCVMVCRYNLGRYAGYVEDQLVKCWGVQGLVFVCSCAPIIWVEVTAYSMINYKQRRLAKIFAN